MRVPIGMQDFSKSDLLNSCLTMPFNVCLSSQTVITIKGIHDGYRNISFYIIIYAIVLLWFLFYRTSNPTLEIFFSLDDSTWLDSKELLLQKHTASELSNMQVHRTCQIICEATVKFRLFIFINLLGQIL